jgi:hypothetical protein
VYFEQRVKSVQAVVLRTRTVFLIANLATLVSLAALFNTYASWIRHLPARDAIRADQYMLEAVVRAQVGDLMVVSVPVLGLKFFAADLGLVASGGMLILSVWLYYSFRREQHSIGRLIFDVAEQQDKSTDLLTVKADRLEDAEFVLNELASVFVFVTSDKDRAIGDPERELFAEEGPPIVVWAKRRLLESPFWVVLLCGAADLASLVLPSVIASGKQTLWNSLTTFQQVEASGRIAITLVMAFVIRENLKKADYFFNWTQILYRSLGHAIAKLSGQETTAT